MSRSEYEQKYGVQPTAASSDLDTTPAPIRMTRTEYNELYRPGKMSFGQDFKQDIAETKVAQKAAVERGVTTRGEIESSIASGQTGKAMGAFQKFGTGVLAAGDVLFQTGMGAAKAVLPQKVEQRISDTLGKDLEQIFAPETREQFIKKLEESEGGVFTSGDLDKKTGAFLRETGELYRTDPEFRNTVLAAGGIMEWLSLPGTAKTAITKTADVVGDPVQRTAQLKETASLVADSFANSRQDKRVQNVVDEIEGIETKYAPTRRKADMDPNVNESRTRIAQSNVLENAVDTDGLIRTKEKGGAVEAYRAQTIEGTEDVIKRNLEIEGSKMNLEELKSDLLINISNSGLEGADLTKAIKSIDNEIKGLSMRADEFGDVLLAKIQDVKTSTYKHIDYTKPTGVTYRKTLARTYKEAIERKSDMNIAEVNAELAKYYNDLDRLADLDGKRVKGGRLGRYTASLAGSAIGGVAGSAGGAAGAVAGGLAGGELSAFLQGRSMARTFSKGVQGDVPESGVLAQAGDKKKVFIDGKEAKDLTKADAPVGAPRDLINNPNFPEATKVEIAKIEGQIKQNIKQQKTAIAAGDFTLVEALKNVYQVLVKRLSDTIKAAKDNMADPTQRQGGFIGKNPLQRTRNEAQTSAITTPNTAKAIDSNVPEVEQTVKTTIGDINKTTPDKMAADLVESDIDMANKLYRKDWSNIDNTERVEFMKKYDLVGATEENVKPFLKEALDEYDARWEGTEDALGRGEKGASDIKKPKATTKTTDLVEEAKGKTLDEFVKAQGTPVYHGTSKNRSNLIAKEGFVGDSFFSTKKSNAEIYSGVFESDAEVIEAVVNIKKPAVVDVFEADYRELGMGSEITLPNGSKTTPSDLLNEVDTSKTLDTNDLIALIKDKFKDVDGVVIKNVSDPELDDVVVAFTPDQIKTRTQLEDIWNKANKSGSLLEEAKKYTDTEINFVYNTKKADLGQDFAQDVEPAGRYMNVGFDEFPGGEGMVKGTVTFKKPLVIEWETSRAGGWKTKLSEQYGGKTGKELSQAVIDDGYDGIIAVTGDNPKEAVNLQTFRK